MKLKCKFSGIEYEAAVFDGTQLQGEEVVITDDAGVELSKEYKVVVDSPSGDKVEVMLALGMLVLTDPEGKVTVAHSRQVGAQLEEV